MMLPTSYTTYYQSPVGLLKICCSDEYVTHLIFTESADSLKAESTPLLDQCIQELTEYFEGGRLSFDVPVCQQGTVFQSKVWNELLNIAFGKTISYLILAQRLGDAKCIRAAASSNGKNNISIIVPCHRVIGSNQTLVGYSGGLWRKKWLLDHENKIANGARTLF